MRKPTLETFVYIGVSLICGLAPAIIFGSHMHEYAQDVTGDVLAIVAGVAMAVSLEIAGILSCKNAIQYTSEGDRIKAAFSWVLVVCYVTLGIVGSIEIIDQVLWMAFPIVLIVYLNIGMMVSDASESQKAESKLWLETNTTIALETARSQNKIAEQDARAKRKTGSAQPKKVSTTEPQAETIELSAKSIEQYTESDWLWIQEAHYTKVMEVLKLGKTQAYKRKNEAKLKLAPQSG